MRKDGRALTLRINKLRDNGMLLVDALKTVGLSRKSYMSWMDKLAAEAKAQVTPWEPPVVDSETALPFVSFDQ